MKKLFNSTLRHAVASVIIKSAPNWLARFNRARLGHPRFIYEGAGGIGDDLLCTCVFRELKKRGEANIVFYTWNKSLFRGHPDIDRMVRKRNPSFINPMIHGLNAVQFTYGTPFKEHFLASMCKKAGIKGEINLRPYIFLSPSELNAGRISARQIVLQSAGLGAALPMKNKEWYPERFQEVADTLKSKASIIQLGGPSDPPLKGALDLRGKTSLREAAAILANSRVFVGQVGFLMHLARAVDCRSAIVYGGRETPQATGYIANQNLVGITPCSPCWEENKCDLDRECMKMISVESVVNAAEEQIEQFGKPLETETVVI